MANSIRTNMVITRILVIITISKANTIIRALARAPTRSSTTAPTNQWRKDRTTTIVEPIPPRRTSSSSLIRRPRAWQLLLVATPTIQGGTTLSSAAGMTTPARPTTAVVHLWSLRRRTRVSRIPTTRSTKRRVNSSSNSNSRRKARHRWRSSNLNLSTMHWKRATSSLQPNKRSRVDPTRPQPSTPLKHHRPSQSLLASNSSLQLSPNKDHRFWTKTK